MNVMFSITKLHDSVMRDDIGTCSHLISPQDKYSQIPFSMSMTWNGGTVKLPGLYRTLLSEIKLGH